MKIYVICGKHPLKSSGGYATYTHALCKSLKQLNYDVNIIAISDKVLKENSDIGTIHTISSSYLPTKSSTVITATFFLWAKKIDNLLEKLILDDNEKCIIYGIGPWTYAGLKTKKIFKEKVKLVNIFFTSMTHETFWLMKGIKISDYGIFLRIKYSIIHLYSKIILEVYEKRALEKSDLILIHYDFAKKILIEKMKISNLKIEKIPYYSEIYEKRALYSKYDKKIESNIHKNNNDEIKKFRCISICRQESRKGINYFLRALKILKKEGIPVKGVIVGSGNLLSKNIRLAEKLKINDIVEFKGFIPNISSELKSSDVFIQPSLQEGSGSISVFEAFISEIPVITTDCDGLPEDIENNVNGILVSKMNEYELANAIKKLYQNKDMAHKLVINAQKTIISKFSSNEMIKGIEKINKKLFQN